MSLSRLQKLVLNDSVQDRAKLEDVIAKIAAIKKAGAVKPKPVGRLAADATPAEASKHKREREAYETAKVAYDKYINADFIEVKRKYNLLTKLQQVVDYHAAVAEAAKKSRPVSKSVRIAIDNTIKSLHSGPPAQYANERVNAMHKGAFEKNANFAPLLKQYALHTVDFLKEASVVATTAAITALKTAPNMQLFLERDALLSTGFTINDNAQVALIKAATSLVDTLAGDAFELLRLERAGKLAPEHLYQSVAKAGGSTTANIRDLVALSNLPIIGTLKAKADREQVYNEAKDQFVQRGMRENKLACKSNKSTPKVTPKQLAATYDTFAAVEAKAGHATVTKKSIESKKSPGTLVDKLSYSWVGIDWTEDDVDNKLKNFSGEMHSRCNNTRSIVFPDPAKESACISKHASHTLSDIYTQFITMVARTARHAAELVTAKQSNGRSARVLGAKFIIAAVKILLNTYGRVDSKLVAYMQAAVDQHKREKLEKIAAREQKSQTSSASTTSVPSASSSKASSPAVAPAAAEAFLEEDDDDDEPTPAPVAAPAPVVPKASNKPAAKAGGKPASQK